MTIPNTELILSELKDYLAFRDLNPGFTLSEYAWHKLTPDLLISTMAMLWPKFIMYDGGVFFENSFSEKGFEKVFRDWMAHFNGDVHEVERIMNHNHVRDLIMSESRLPDSVVRYIGEAFVLFWQAALNSQFPNLPIVVRSEWDAENDDVVIVIHQSG